MELSGYEKDTCPKHSNQVILNYIKSGLSSLDWVSNHFKVIITYGLISWRFAMSCELTRLNVTIKSVVNQGVG